MSSLDRRSARSVNVARPVRLWQSQAVQYTYAILARNEDDAKRYVALGALPDCDIDTCQGRDSLMNDLLEQELCEMIIDLCDVEDMTAEEVDAAVKKSPSYRPPGQ